MPRDAGWVSFRCTMRRSIPPSRLAAKCFPSTSSVVASVGGFNGEGVGASSGRGRCVERDGASDYGTVGQLLACARSLGSETPDFTVKRLDCVRVMKRARWSSVLCT